MGNVNQPFLLAVNLIMFAFLNFEYKNNYAKGVWWTIVKTVGSPLSTCYAHYVFPGYFSSNKIVLIMHKWISTHLTNINCMMIVCPIYSIVKVRTFGPMRALVKGWLFNVRIFELPHVNHQQFVLFKYSARNAHCFFFKGSVAF